MANSRTVLICSQENLTATEEDEPKFKYQRLTNDLKNIVNKDVITACAVHPKFVVFGTYSGRVYLLDHLGNLIHSQLNQRQEEFVHMVAVNEVDVDSRGEYIATCSNDGKVLILGLFTDENNQNINFSHLVHSVALDPDPKASGYRRFIVGHRQLVLYEKNFLKKQKCNVLSPAEDNVISLCWRGSFVAWASRVGVRIHELNQNCSLGLMKWEQPLCGRLESYRCNFYWSDERTLLVGWVDKICVCIIRKRNFSEATLHGLPFFLVDTISSFKTNFYISGLAPLQGCQLVILGYLKEKTSDHKSMRPILSVIEYKDNNINYNAVIRVDSLSLRGYQEYSVNDYILRYLNDENCYYIVAPKDIVIASLLNVDDRIQWLIEHKKFEKAVELMQCVNGDVQNLAKLYIDDLLQNNEFEKAARVCWELFDAHNTDDWQELAFKFLDRQNLRSLSLYLPTSDDCKLNPHVYEMVLYEFLKYNSVGLLDVVKQWPKHLYNRVAIINAIRGNLREGDCQRLLETLAILYSHENDYENALCVYLKLQHKDVFDFIRKHNLHSTIIQKLIIPLLDLNRTEAINLLMERQIAPDIIIEQLEQRLQPEYLYLFLKALQNVDNSGSYDWKLLNLVAKYEPNKLLPFLKRSQHYPMQEALDICKNLKFYPEMVYLLSRMGNIIEALTIIIHLIKDIKMAIEFCKEHDDSDLWNLLIDESVKNPEILTKLFDGIIGYINPEGLLQKIKSDQKIPGLQQSLFQMLWDYRLQAEIQQKCLKFWLSNYFKHHSEIILQQRYGHCVTEHDVCVICQRNIIIKDATIPLNGVYIFNCGHFYHESCLCFYNDKEKKYRQCYICIINDDDSETTEGHP